MWSLTYELWLSYLGLASVHVEEMTLDNGQGMSRLESRSVPFLTLYSPQTLPSHKHDNHTSYTGTRKIAL